MWHAFSVLFRAGASPGLRHGRNPGLVMWYAFSVLFGRIQTVLPWRFCQRKYHEQSTVING
jgi:hypothetical protein